MSTKEALVASLQRDLAASRAERESAHVKIWRLTVSTVKGHTDVHICISFPPPFLILLGNITFTLLKVTQHIRSHCVHVTIGGVDSPVGGGSTPSSEREGAAHTPASPSGTDSSSYQGTYM